MTAGVLTQALNGLSFASILVLVALGLAVIFGLLDVINLAHGDLFMLGMYSVVLLQGAMGGFWVGVLAAPVVVGMVGLAVERGVIQWLRGRPFETLLATWGCGIVIREGVKLVFGAEYRQIPNPLRGGVTLGPIVYPAYRLLLMLITVAVLVAIGLWLYRTPAGLKLRAMLQDRDTASAFGVDADQMTTFAFVVGAMLAGLAGALMGPLVSVGPEVGLIYLASAFMVVIIGGVGTVLGVVGGGILIGGGEAFTGFFLPPTIAEAIVLVFAVIVLRLRPRGLFG